MKTNFLLIVSLLFCSWQTQAQMTSCNAIFSETFETNGGLPEAWVEYNTSGRVTVSNNQLVFNHNSSQPSVYYDFTSASDHLAFSFDVSASRNSASCVLSLLASSGQYLSSIDIGAKSASIKYATTMDAGSPSGFSQGAPQIVLQKNTSYTLTTVINFTSKTVDYYADGTLFANDIPFLESAKDMAKLDIQLLYMYSNSGYFYFDNITLAMVEENRLTLWNKISDAETLLTNAQNSDDDYPQEAFDALISSLNDAKTTEADCEATDAQINTSIDKLAQAILDFEDAKIPETQSISINALDTKQDIIMVGGDMERNAPAVLSAPNKYEIIKWLIMDIPFNTYRVKYDKLQEMTEGKLDLDGAYADQVKTMKLIKLANPDIKFYATMKSDYNGYSQGNRNNLPTFIYDYAYDSETETSSGTKSFDAVKYGRFLADYIEYMSDNEVPITYLSTSKEWTQVMTAARAKTTIETLIDELKERNIEMPLIIDPGAWSIKGAYNTVNAYVANDANKYLYGYSTHNYNTTNITWSDFVTAANNAGKVAFDDESGHGSGGPTNGAYEMPITQQIKTYSKKCDMYEGGIQGECFFELWMGNFSYARPIMFSSTENGRRIRSYYIMKKFAENLVGTKYVSQTKKLLDGVSSTAFIKDSCLVLWLINTTENNISDGEVNISQLGLKENMAIEHHYWDSTSVITGVESTITAYDDDYFSINLLPRSINCYIINPYSDDNQSSLSVPATKSATNNLRVYPNPSTDVLNISSTSAIESLKLYNMNGQEIECSLHNGNSIATSSLETGLYILHLNTSTDTYVRGFIKE